MEDNKKTKIESLDELTPEEQKSLEEAINNSGDYVLLSNYQLYDTWGKVKDFTDTEFAVEFLRFISVITDRTQKIGGDTNELSTSITLIENIIHNITKYGVYDFIKENKLNIEKPKAIIRKNDVIH